MLDGVSILDLTDHRGEIAACLLGDLGAEVIKVEPRGGNPARWQPPLLSDTQPGQASLQFAAYNANKQSIVLDPDIAEDLDVLRGLVAEADIVFDSGPPGYLADFGLAGDEILAVNPAVVRVLITAFGSDGPRAHQPASDLTLAALGGPMRVQGPRDQAPVQVSVPQAWRHAGAEASIAALVARARARQTGRGQLVDVSAQVAMTWTMLNAMEAWAVQGSDFERAGSTLKLAASFELCSACADGHLVAVPLGRTVGPLVKWMHDQGAVGPEWLDEDWETFDMRLLGGEAGVSDFDGVFGAFQEAFRRSTKRDLLSLGLEVGATLAPVNTLSDLADFDHLAARGFWQSAVVTPQVEVEGPGGFVAIDGVRIAVERVAPAPDEHGPSIRVREPLDVPPLAAAGPSDELPLAGLKVADFSWIGVGPITTKCLADHGATVVRVESENHVDGLRNQPPFKEGEPGLNRSNFYGPFNTSKLGLSLDLKTDEGIGVARRLLDWADVAIDSFTPGTMERLGLGYERACQTNPRLIMVTTSLMGSGGPASAMAGYGYHAAAIAGFFELVGWPDGPPQGPYLAYTDTIGPRFITPTILAALERREQTDEGCFIEAAQLEIALQLLAPELLDLQASGRLAGRLGNRSDHVAPQGAYPCSGEDQWCAITVASEQQWSALCAVMGFDDLAVDAALASVEGRLVAHDLIDERMSAWTAGRSALEVEQTLAAAGLPAGAVQSSQDLFSDPQYLHRGVHHWLEHSECGSTPYTGHAYRIEGYDHGPRTAAPMLGEHTFGVLTDLLGLTGAEVAELAIANAIV